MTTRLGQQLCNHELHSHTGQLWRLGRFSQWVRWLITALDLVRPAKTTGHGWCATGLMISMQGRRGMYDRCGPRKCVDVWEMLAVLGKSILVFPAPSLLWKARRLRLSLSLTGGDLTPYAPRGHLTAIQYSGGRRSFSNETRSRPWPSERDLDWTIGVPVCCCKGPCCS